jgi:hypothetical protein
MKEFSDLAQSGNSIRMVLALLWHGWRKAQTLIFQGCNEPTPFGQGVPFQAELCHFQFRTLECGSALPL